MRRIVLVLAVAVFLAALILDTGAVLRVAGFYGGLFLRAHPRWVAAAAGLGLAAVLWPRRPWRLRGRRRGKRRPGRAGARPRQRAPAKAAPKRGRALLVPSTAPAAAPRARKPRKPRRPVS